MAGIIFGNEVSPGLFVELFTDLNRKTAALLACQTEKFYFKLLCRKSRNRNEHIIHLRQ